jgi:hypothetical protein
MTVGLSPQHQVAATLDRLADERGEECWRRAAAELRGLDKPAGRRGRKSIDDDAALVEMESHVAGGASVELAAKYVAVGLTGQSSISTARRLARKYRAKHGI